MKNFFIFILGMGMGAVLIWIYIKQSALEDSDKENRSKESLIKRQAEEKEEGKRRILAELEKQTPLSNNRVERLLGVSDATATRYLDELEKEGKIRQVGKTGRSVYYEKA